MWGLSFYGFWFQTVFNCQANQFQDTSGLPSPLKDSIDSSRTKFSSWSYPFSTPLTAKGKTRNEGLIIFLIPNTLRFHFYQTLHKRRIIIDPSPKIVPSLPPANLTIMLLSMNFAKFNAVSFCLDILSAGKITKTFLNISSKMNNETMTKIFNFFEMEQLAKLHVAPSAFYILHDCLGSLAPQRGRYFPQVLVWQYPGLSLKISSS